MKKLNIEITFTSKIPFIKINFSIKRTVDIKKEKYLIDSLNDDKNKKFKLFLEDLFYDENLMDDLILETAIIQPQVSLSEKGRDKTELERKKI